MAKNNKRNQGRFAGLPYFVMESDTYVKLPPLAKCLLYELVTQYNGHNNGYLSLTRDDLKKRGFPSTNSNTKAFNALCESRLITRTRHGSIARGKRICHLYAINWQPIDELKNKLLDDKPNFASGFTVWLTNNSERVKVISR